MHRFYTEELRSHEKHNRIVSKHLAFFEITISAGFHLSNSSSKLLNLASPSHVDAQDSPVEESMIAILNDDLAKIIELRTERSSVDRRDSSYIGEPWIFGKWNCSFLLGSWGLSDRPRSQSKMDNVRFNYAGSHGSLGTWYIRRGSFDRWSLSAHGYWTSNIGVGWSGCAGIF